MHSNKNIWIFTEINLFLIVDFFYFSQFSLSLIASINEDIIIALKKLKTNCSLVKQVSDNFRSSNSWNWTLHARPARRYRTLPLASNGPKILRRVTGNLTAPCKQTRFQRGDFDDGILLSVSRPPEVPRVNEVGGQPITTESNYWEQLTQKLQ